jgi:hypothetical protein
MAMYDIDLEDFPAGLPEEIMEILKPKKHRREFLVEDCFILSLSDLGKGLLRPAANDDGLVVGKCGRVLLTNRFKELPVEFSVQLYSGNQVQLNVSCKHRNSVLNQAIKLQTNHVPYGLRPYLVCNCGYRGNKLYLSSREYSFLCRRCAGLYYDVTSINRKSPLGRLKYQLWKKFKIENQKARVTRVSYMGKFTRRAKRLMELVKAV